MIFSKYGAKLNDSANLKERVIVIFLKFLNIKTRKLLVN